MQLGECVKDDVVQHVHNRKFYRYDKPEGERTRIRPLELFPNGLLVCKPTDTIIDSDLIVQWIGRWTDSLYVPPSQGQPQSIQSLERERVLVMRELVELEAEMLTIAPNKRGSHANKVKAKAVRLAALNTGLFRESPLDTTAIVEESPVVRFAQLDVVELPSGMAARYLGLVQTGAGTLAKIKTATLIFHVPPEVLRLASDRWVSTV